MVAKTFSRKLKVLSATILFTVGLLLAACEQRSDQAQPLLSWIGERPLEAVVVKNEQSAFTIKLDRSADQVIYSMPEYPDWTLDTQRVEELLKYIKTSNLAHLFTLDKAPADYGILGTFSFKLSSADTQAAIEVGDYSDYVKGYYAYNPERKEAFLIPTELYELLDKPALYYRSDHLFRLRLDELNALELTAPNVHLNLVKTSEQGWIIKSDAAASSRADREQLLKLVRNLNSIKSRDSEDYQPDKHKFTCTLGITDQQNRSSIWELSTLRQSALDFSNPEIYLRKQGAKVVYKIASQNMPVLSSAEYDYRSLDEAPAILPDVDQIMLLDTARTSLVLKKDAQGNWLVNGAVGDQPFVLAYLEQLSNLPAGGFPPPSEPEPTGVASR